MRNLAMKRKNSTQRRQEETKFFRVPNTCYLCVYTPSPCPFTHSRRGHTQEGGQTHTSRKGLAKTESLTTEKEEGRAKSIELLERKVVKRKT